MVLVVLLFSLSPALRGEFLFNSYLVPSFDGAPNSEYSAWDTFYTPYGNPNYPDYAAPYGTWQPASAAGITPPANSSPTNPSAYWDSRNPTISQIGTSTAFIIGPGSTGNIYSFAAPQSYQLQDSTSYDLGSVVFQFQTDGTVVDFESIKLQYTNGSGTLIELSPAEMIREYRSSGSSFGGTTNRTAVQWDLSGLDVSSYSIVWASDSASLSFQQASLDTWNSSAEVVPESRRWIASGAGNWSDGTNWSEDDSSHENGNVHFLNAGAATVTLDDNRTIGELIFNTASNVTISSPGSYLLTGNTGITTTALATGIYTIDADYAFGAFNIFQIDGGTVQMNGVISGSYGLLVSGNGTGTVILANNNTFTGSLGLQGGTLKLEGTNAYTGSTAILWGTLIVGADAPSGAVGALGNATSNVILGADSATYVNIGAGNAAIYISGDHYIERNISMAPGTFEKTLGAMDTITGATFSGAIAFGTSNDIKLTAVEATDKVNFTGGMSGGIASTPTVTSDVVIDGQGTVVYGGAGKTYSYLNDTLVSSGMLKLDQGASFTGNGKWTVSSEAKLMVNGTLGGTGTLTINGGSIGGSGTINKTFTVASGSTLTPGDGVGTLHSLSETWGSGGSLLWEISSANGGEGIDWDLINIDGTLTLASVSLAPFHIKITSRTLVGGDGIVSDFNAYSDYTWLIATASDGITGFDPDAFFIDTSDFDNALSGNFNLSVIDDNLYLNYSAVPEPSAALLISAGLTVVIFLRRRARIYTPALT